jgi:putative DNA primase/helicase
VSEAETIARALGGKRNGNGYLCRCPVRGHGKGRGDRNPSLSVRDGACRVLLHCFSGCESRDVLAELIQRGVLGATKRQHLGQHHHQHDDAGIHQHFDADHHPDRHLDHHQDRHCKIKSTEAYDIWRKSRPAAGTIIETKYLRGLRGITIAPPRSLRFSYQPYPYKNPRLELPAMIAAVQAPDGKGLAAQITWIDPHRHERLERYNVGELGAGAVRLAAPTEVLGLAEGTETALAAMQIHRVPAWASLGAGRMHKVIVPDTVRQLLLFADNNDTGRNGADSTAERHEREGRHVLRLFPPAGLKDWAEVTAAYRTG